MRFVADSGSSPLRYNPLLCGCTTGARGERMKKVIIILLTSSIFCISCTKKETIQTNKTIVQETKIEKENSITKDELKENIKEYAYVNSVEGLRIRKNSDTESEKIGSLKNKEKVEVVSRGQIPVEIDRITSEWYEIKTEEGIQGFAFGGYLEKSLNNIEIIQAVEGEYWDEKDSKNITIKNKGTGKLLVTTNIPIFRESQKVIEVNKIFSSDLFQFIQDGRGGLNEIFTIKFNDNKELILQDDRYELLNMFEENETEVVTHKTDIFIKK